MELNKKQHDIQFIEFIMDAPKCGYLKRCSFAFHGYIANRLLK